MPKKAVNFNVYKTLPGSIGEQKFVTEQKLPTETRQNVRDEKKEVAQAKRNKQKYMNDLYELFSMRNF